ncbi:MAG: hypothetical protein KME05_05905 [Gloeocapsa sp. UFS-A4-WI-NPMV-4B04]|nr:hypothetical protein [Gloeocapsa sp. UFS-A4-WI-NPMV-4B04]
MLLAEVGIDMRRFPSILIAVYHILRQQQPYRDYRTSDAAQRTEQQLLKKLQH